MRPQRPSSLGTHGQRVETAFGLVDSRPTAFAALAGPCAVGAADRRIAALMELVHWQVVVANVRPDVVVRPVGERARLPELMAVVPAELQRVGARRGLVAADARGSAARVGGGP